MRSGLHPQLSQVTNKAGCGGTGLCRCGLEARCQIETAREMEADAEPCLIAAGECAWLLEKEKKRERERGTESDEGLTEREQEDERQTYKKREINEGQRL